MSWLNALLPIWIIGAPLVYAVFDWVTTPKSTSMASHDLNVRRVPLTA